MSIRGLVKEVIFKVEFLVNQSLGALLDYLRVQKWDFVFGGEKEVVDKQLVQEFYGSLSIVKRGAGLVGTYVVDDVPYAFSSAELATLLKVPHKGYGDYTSRLWPDEIPQEEALKVIGKDDSTGKLLPPIKMKPTERLLHNYIVKNVTPRGEKGSSIQIQEAVLMVKILKREPVNLPLIIMGHMNHIREQASHRLGFPSIIKRIMLSHNAYTPVGEEEECSRPLDEVTIRRMGFVKIAGKGWCRDAAESTGDSKVAADIEELKEGLKSLIRSHEELTLSVEENRLLLLQILAQNAQSSAPSKA